MTRAKFERPGAFPSKSNRPSPEVVWRAAERFLRSVAGGRGNSETRLEP